LRTAAYLSFILFLKKTSVDLLVFSKQTNKALAYFYREYFVRHNKPFLQHISWNRILATI